MRRTLILAGALAVVAPSLRAQTVTWNDRPPASSWTDDAPRVRVYIDGPRAVPLGAPMKVRFEVSDNAYVTVVRVDDNGRMTILFPYSRNQRAAARGNFIHQVRNPRLRGDAAFIATDNMGGYVFALASYVPLDLTGFENRDYDRVGGWSKFTVANRQFATRPDVFIDRFAAAVLWDVETPYDYDVDYYFPQGYPGTVTSASLCQGFYNAGFTYAYGQYHYGWEAWDIAGDSYRRACSNYYQSVRCYSSLALYNNNNCGIGSVIAAAGPANPAGPVQPVPGDSAVPNEGVVKGGLFGPSPVPVIPTGPDPGSTLPAVGRFDQVRPADGSDLDHIMSIPARATRKMKEDDARNERSNAGGASPARTGFDRADVTGGKTEKTRTADASDAPARVQPPAREPTKTKGTSEPRRETARTGYGSSDRNSNTRPSNGPDRVTRPTMDNKPQAGGTVAAPNPPTIQGTTTEKKKPPM